MPSSVDPDDVVFSPSELSEESLTLAGVGFPEGRRVTFIPNRPPVSEVPCPITSISISGISINPGCYVGDNGPGCNNNSSNKWQDVSLNGPATIISQYTLNDWCGDTIYDPTDCLWIFNTGLIRVYNYSPTPHFPPPPFFDPSHCDEGSPTPYDSTVEGAVMRLAGHWYATIRNPDYGPAAGGIPFTIFEGNSATTTIPNGITSFDTSCNQYSISGVLSDIYWGSCAPGSGTDNFALLAAGGSVLIVP